MLVSLLRNAGCQNIQKRPHLVDFSYGSEAHEGYVQDLMVGFRLIQPFLTQLNLLTMKEFDQIYLQMMGEMFADSFWSPGIRPDRMGYAPIILPINQK